MRRIVFSIAFFRKSCQYNRLTSTKSRWKFYTQVGHRSFHTAWTQSGRSARSSPHFCRPTVEYVAPIFCTCGGVHQPSAVCNLGHRSGGTAPSFNLKATARLRQGAASARCICSICSCITCCRANRFISSMIAMRSRFMSSTTAIPTRCKRRNGKFGDILRGNPIPTF